MIYLRRADPPAGLPPTSAPARGAWTLEYPRCRSPTSWVRWFPAGGTRAIYVAISVARTTLITGSPAPKAMLSDKLVSSPMPDETSTDGPEAAQFREAAVDWARRNTITVEAARACMLRLGLHDEHGNLTPEYLD
jgi:hypothetical protein